MLGGSPSGASVDLLVDLVGLGGAAVAIPEVGGADPGGLVSRLTIPLLDGAPGGSGGAAMGAPTGRRAILGVSTGGGAALGGSDGMGDPDGMVTAPTVGGTALDDPDGVVTLDTCLNLLGVHWLGQVIS